GGRAPLPAREDAHGRRDRRRDDAARADVGSRRARAPHAARRRLAVSFILDALRKSERERRQDAAPGIARIPDAVPPRTTPTWAIATIAALGVGVVVLGGAWIHALITAPAGTAAHVGGTRLDEPQATRVEAVSLPPAPEPSAAASASNAAARADDRSHAGAPAAEPRGAAGGSSLETLAQPHREPD